MKKKTLTKENWKSQIENQKTLFPIHSLTKPRRQRLSSDEPQQTIVRREEKLREREWEERRKMRGLERKGTLTSIGNDAGGSQRERRERSGRGISDRETPTLWGEKSHPITVLGGLTPRRKERRGKKAVARERRGCAREDREWRREKTKFQPTIMGRPKS